jgi:hypothetical protein
MKFDCLMKIQGRKSFEKKERDIHTPFSIIEAVVRARTKDREEMVYSSCFCTPPLLLSDRLRHTHIHNNYGV